MRGKPLRWLAGLTPSAPAIVGGLLFACALVADGIGARSAKAQSSVVHAAFSDAAANKDAADQPHPGTVRLASSPKPAAAKPKPASSAARKPSTMKTMPPPASERKQSAEELPTLPMKATLPLAGSTPGDGLQLTQDDKGLLTLTVRDHPLSQVLSLLAQRQQLNIVASNDIDAMISITLQKVPMEEALTAILSVANYTWVRKGNIILITSMADSVNLPADVQGRQIQVFDLDFASAAVVSETIQNFLSPIGKVSISASSKKDNRLTQERVVVEDLPESLARIATYIAQIDQPPRQVLIEAHVLQVTLDDTTKCGVNLSQLMRIGHSNFTVKTTGLANSSAETAFLATLDGGDLGGVLEAIQTTTDAKTLGSPKLLVLNEQEARLQVGQHLGFKVSTTTETSTTQNVQFLDVGVVLRIIPRITRDGCVLLHVRPEVSKGDVNPETGLPESDTAELETDVMLSDGQGMVIGGLIKENDTVTQSKVPYLGNVRGVGWLFRRSEATKERVEIIVALVPHVQPYDAKFQPYEQGEVVRASVPLFHGPLCRTDRPWDPVLPDGKRVKYPLVPDLHQQAKRGYFHDLGPQYSVPPYPLPEQHFYSDHEECDLAEPQATDPVMRDPFVSGEDLPLPSGVEKSDGAHIISDQPK
jgi:type IV pilus assembly protein PilQ